MGNTFISNIILIKLIKLFDCFNSYVFLVPLVPGIIAFFRANLFFAIFLILISNY
jgi:hypothetical protein